ncbi:rhodanese-like domain-containing protein [Flavobacterium sp.]|uniref:rhodanese-like domain-containing protein n=1 Tax=Flavobacterium sp. TaxID=239 RepID=UPI003752DBDD
MKPFFIPLIIASLLFINCNAQNSEKIKTIAGIEFQKKVENIQKPQLVDVRTPEEFDVEHLGNATNINWNSPDFESKIKVLNKKKPIFVYCKAGGRSIKAATKLAELGFTEIYNLEGGILSWNSKNLPIKK